MEEIMQNETQLSSRGFIMAGASLLTLIDDIASVLDDVASMTKVAAKKTAGVLGDDLALNAQQVSGVKADRELPVVWAVAKGSLVNKAILVPTALAISAFLPWAVTPLLMIGGAYLCFEGVEKVMHSLFHPHRQEAKKFSKKVLKKTAVKPGKKSIKNKVSKIESPEKQKIKGAIRTDFILSAEIIVISLGTIAGAVFLKQVAVLVGISLLMTVGVYGLVAGIVKLDDAGLHLAAQKGKDLSKKIRRFLGRIILRLAPNLLKSLSIVGTIAMFLVGGSILLHGIPPAENWMHHLTEKLNALPGLGLAASLLFEAVLGFLAGLAAFLIFKGVAGVAAIVKSVRPSRRGS